MDPYGFVSAEAIKKEIELVSFRYHIIAAWIAIIFNPLFAYTDYINLQDHWQRVAIIRISISMITLLTVFLARHQKWPSYSVVVVPLMLISLQNAFTFSLITNQDVLGHNINFIALLIGASLFLVLPIRPVLTIALISAVTTTLSIALNSSLVASVFFVQGGFLLMVAGIFMVISIRMRYILTGKEIIARLALKASSEEIKRQAEEVRATNENLETIVLARTLDLERKNQALEEYAWINAHKLRSPVASILGLMSLLKREEVKPETRVIMNHLQASTERLDEVVSSITIAIERAEYPKAQHDSQQSAPKQNLTN